VGARSWGIQFHAEVTERDAISWTEADSDKAAEAGTDPAELIASIRNRMGDWNRVGRGVCGRFLDLVAAER
jgi:GMP synthase-like glutamine amidotransferase